MKKLKVVFLCLICLVSCIGEDFIEVDSSRNESLRIIAPSSVGIDTIMVGDSITYRAEFVNANDDLGSTSLIWLSSRPEIASVNQEGVIIAHQEGVVNIKVQSTVMIDGRLLEDNRLLVVQNTERVEVTPKSASLLVGDSIIFTAKYYNRNGEAENAVFTWNNANTSVASLDNNGKLIATSAGLTEIKAIANGVESPAINVTVVSDSMTAASIDIRADTSVIEKGDTLRYTAIVKNILGQELDNQNVVWNSSDVSIVSIDQSGLATGVEVGSSDISASLTNVVSNSLELLVNQANVTSRTGSFQNENGYRVSGDVELRINSNNDLELSFTNFSSQRGPDLVIYLGNNTSSGVEISRLNQLSGSFTVNVSSMIKIDDYDYVLIWCKAVNAAFGSALLN